MLSHLVFQNGPTKSKFMCSHGVVGWVIMETIEEGQIDFCTSVAMSCHPFYLHVDTNPCAMFAHQLFDTNRTPMTMQYLKNLRDLQTLVGLFCRDRLWAHSRNVWRFGKFSSNLETLLTLLHSLHAERNYFTRKHCDKAVIIVVTHSAAKKLN